MNYKTMQGLAVAGLILAGGFFSACASKPPEAGISSASNPRDQIAQMTEKLEAARAANIDVLAADQFEKADKYVEKAKSNLADNKDQEKIIDDLRFAKVSLDEAYVISQNRQEKAPGVFEARQNAIKAGALKHSDLKNEWKDVDGDVASVADKLQGMSAEKLTKFQARYVELERKAVVQTQLGGAQAKVNGAKKEGASKKSPATLKKAELALKNAESAISTNVRNPDTFAKAVADANASAGLLGEVTEVIQANGKNLPEAAALSMVTQKHQISDLKTNLTQSEKNKAGVESQLSSKEQALAAEKEALAEKNKALSSAQSTVAMQKALEASRSQFSPNEAEAYQQGGNLLIRLKSVNFASGRSDLPAQSMPLLAKVSEVAKSLHAREIKVEGHTDSIGAAELNKDLSTKRATAVATYFKTNGFDQIQVGAEGVGFDKPIATNKSKAGRAQNRRVDIIIVPDATESKTE